MASTATNDGNKLKAVVVTTRKAPDKLTFCIDREAQCNTIAVDGKLIGQISQGTKVINTVLKDGVVVGSLDSNGQVVNQDKTDTLITTLAKFIKCSDSTKNGCFGGNGRFAEPLEPSTAVKKRTSARLAKSADFTYFQSFPQEIKEMILANMVNPQTVKAYHERTGFLVVVDREWADIALYQVCHNFRQYAIKTFGVPKKRTFPFDPANDTLYLRWTETLDLNDLLRKARNANKFALKVTRIDIDHRYIDYELWDRIKTVESEARMPCENSLMLPCGDRSMFRKIETWRILVIQLDTCRENTLLSTQFAFKKDDWSILKAVFNCLSGHSTPSWKPKSIEICRKGCMCSLPRKLKWKGTRGLPSEGPLSLAKLDNNSDVLDRRFWT
ncbi:hypothetical protein VP1G_02997 [Cytospora mali]|uniref:2EXR domain-containing protein n=1 Tax=Cytospora mali TaxID=578113 RepID=A0A194UVP4_CYTMA|nr:hypothetical protein VP1G_02997 [Valsa mali var. pyri (nom. inval.)]